jgi:hypothetical protein
MNQKTTNKHPSGLTWERWNWPFKTQEERAIVAKWFKKKEKNQPAERALV